MLFRYFNTYLLNYAGLLVLALLLFAPSLLPAFYEPGQEQLRLAVWHVLATDGMLYADSWASAPPVGLWLEGLLQLTFGTGAPLAGGLIALGLSYFNALVVNQFLVSYRFVERFVMWPGMLMLMVQALPWYEQGLTPMLLASTWMLLAVVLLIQRFTSGAPLRGNRLFGLGVLLGVALGTHFLSLFTLLIVLVGYLIIAPVRLRNFLSLVGGLVISLATMGAILAATGDLRAFYEQAILGALDLLRFSGVPGQGTALSNLLLALKFWGVLVLVGLLGFFYWRSRFHQQTVQQRRAETVMALWFLGSLLAVILQSEFSFSSLRILWPPLILYASLFLEYRFRGGRRLLVGFLILLAPLTSVLHVGSLALPWFQAELRPVLGAVYPEATLQRTERQLKPAPDEANIRRQLAAYPAETPLWILGHRPELHRRLGRPPATAYTDYPLAWLRWSWLSHNIRRRGNLLAPPEDLPGVFRELVRRQPRLILDIDGLFPAFRERLPLLLAPYRRVSSSPYPLYVREAPLQAKPHVWTPDAGAERALPPGDSLRRLKMPPQPSPPAQSRDEAPGESSPAPAEEASPEATEPSAPENTEAQAPEPVEPVDTTGVEPVELEDTPAPPPAREDSAGAEVPDSASDDAGNEEPENQEAEEDEPSSEPAPPAEEAPTPLPGSDATPKP